MLAYSGKGSFEIASVDLNALIQEMTELLHVSLARSITLRYDFDEALPAVEVDPTQIRQVVMNLVMNAAEAVGEQAGRINVSTAVITAHRAMLRGYIQGDRLPEGRYVRLEVADTGVGIEPEMLHRIFDPFFTTKFAGRGLGLAAVLGIVHGHHGALQVVSAPGAGAVFRMLLPAQAVSPAPAPATPPGPAWRGTGMALVVDDEAGVQNVLSRMLESLGFTVATAGNGNEALRRLDEHTAALSVVLLDVTMPGMDGEQTLRELHARNPHVPVLIVSGLAEQDLRQRFAALGVRDVLAKPFTVQGLAAKLQALLG